MASGSSVLKEVQAKINTIETEYNNVHHELTANQKLQKELSKNKAKAFEQLAEFYLPELTREGVRETLRERQSTVAKILEEKELHQANLTQLMGTNWEERCVQEKQLARLEEVISTNDSSLDLAKRNVSKELTENAVYSKLRTEAQEAGQKIAQLKAQHQAFVAQAETKLPAYQQNKLFSYLLGRGFADKYHCAAKPVDAVGNS